MSDRSFELSIKLLTLAVVLGVVAGVVGRVSLAPVIIGAIVVEFGVGGLLLHVWGKSYLSRQ